MRRQRRDYDAVLRDTFVQESIAQLRTDFQAAEQRITPEMIELMKKVRERFIELELPSMVKVLRLTYEHVDAEGNFDFVYTGPKPEEEEEEAAEGEEPTEAEAPEEEVEEASAEDLGLSSFEYLLQLLSKPTNKYNREEIREFAAQLKALQEE